MTQSRTRSNATVDGRLLQAVVDGVVDATGNFEDRTRGLLTEHGLAADPSAGDAYPCDRFVALLETIGRETGPNTLERIGRAVPEHLEWPSNVDSVADALAAVESTLDGRHGSVPIHCRFDRTGAHAGRVDLETPYPAAFERGLLAGLGREFGYGPGHVTVRQAATVRTDGGRERGDARSLDLAWTHDPTAETTIAPHSAD